MTALDRIKEIGTFTEAQLRRAKRQGVDYEELEYMLRAFQVMREIAVNNLENLLDSESDKVKAVSCVEEEFEEKMKQKE